MKKIILGLLTLMSINITAQTKIYEIVNKGKGIISSIFPADLLLIDSYTAIATPTLQEVTDISSNTTNSITIGDLNEYTTLYPSQLQLNSSGSSIDIASSDLTLAWRGSQSLSTNFINFSPTVEALQINAPSSSGTLALISDILNVATPNFQQVLYTGGTANFDGGAIRLYGDNTINEGGANTINLSNMTMRPIGGHFYNNHIYMGDYSIALASRDLTSNYSAVISVNGINDASINMSVNNDNGNGYTIVTPSASELGSYSTTIKFPIPSESSEIYTIATSVNGVKADSAGNVLLPLTPYLTSATAAATYQPIGGYLTSYSETDSTVKAINGIVKSNGTSISSAVAGTDYLAPNGSAGALTSFPTLNQNTTGTASTITGTVTESQVTNLVSDLDSKQSTLVSGISIKTVNGTSLLGSGNIAASLPDEDNMFYSSDFISAATTASPPYIGLAISTGTNAANATNANTNHPGVVRMTSSTTANGGYKWQTDVIGIRLGGNETFTAVIAPVNFTTTTMYAGFHDSATSAQPVDGVYFKYTTTGAVVLEAANNSTRTTSAPITTLALNTWYKLKITMNSNATSALGEVFDAAGALIASTSLTTNIPTASGREVGSGITVTESTTTATAMLDLDYIATKFTLIR